MKKIRQWWARCWTVLHHPGQWNWLRISIVANVSIVAALLVGWAGTEVIHQSDINPQLCATCHPMRANVESYTNGTTLDSVHAKAGVECKSCHDYPLDAEIRSGVNFITGNYVVEDDGRLVKRAFGDEMCLQCHIGMEHLAAKTDHLSRNPHLNHWPDLVCGDCHVSHGEQIDMCSECHDNGGQRMTGEEIIPRFENRWADPNAARPIVDQ